MKGKSPLKPFINVSFGPIIALISLQEVTAVEYETLAVERRDGIALVTMNRPEKLNALDRRMCREIIRLREDLENDDDVRAVILTGAGRAFSSGGDIQDIMVRLVNETVKEKEETIRLADQAFLHLKMMEVPTIAAVNGVAAGGGCCLAMACDIRIAMEDAKFALVFVHRGLSGADAGATYFLPRIVGSGWAAELLYTGDFIDAHQAEKLGLVNHVVAPQDLMEASWALARRIADGPAVGMQMTKRALGRSIMSGLADQLDFEAAVQTICFQTEDHQEGVRSFIEKREPQFKGR
ncbi:MAG: enoyl-CoA hydratase [Dehalococcoidia bacterium]|nr:enoyl-CoA hydratase [Dehalococcoidia bacterium]